MVRELPIPPSSLAGESATEVVRVWINADKRMDTSLRTVFPDPMLWGMLLVDIARHVARAYEQDGAHTQDEVLSRIRTGFDAEWGNPTDLGTTKKVEQ
jgi:hypothetical protein